MAISRLAQFPIKGLEYLFSPAGLPLVEKTRSGMQTTTLLVRGAAGVGKTTLAVALASAIAQHNKGLVLYLSSESLPVEISYKSEMLGLVEGSVLVWEDRAEGQVGNLIVQHLAMTDAGQEVMTIADQRRGLTEALLGLVGNYQQEGHATPLRAVILDAFGLPEGGEDDPGLRLQVLGLVQSLEAQGVSVVLVEELGQKTTEALSFIADIAFEISFASDPHSGELVRTLRCPKCRFGLALPGPHNYGLRGGRPSVWFGPPAVLSPEGGVGHQRGLRRRVAGAGGEGTATSANRGAGGPDVGRLAEDVIQLAAAGRDLPVALAAELARAVLATPW